MTHNVQKSLPFWCKNKEDQEVAGGAVSLRPGGSVVALFIEHPLYAKHYAECISRSPWLNLHLLNHVRKDTTLFLDPRKLNQLASVRLGSAGARNGTWLKAHASLYCFPF